MVTPYLVRYRSGIVSLLAGITGMLWNSVWHANGEMSEQRENSMINS